MSDRRSKKWIDCLVKRVNSKMRAIKPQPYCIGLHEFEILGVMTQKCLVAVSGNVENQEAFKEMAESISQDPALGNHFLVVNSTGESARNYGLGSKRELKRGCYLCVEPKLRAECDKLSQYHGVNFRSLGESYLLVTPETGKWKKIKSCQECRKRKREGKFCPGRARSASPFRW